MPYYSISLSFDQVHMLRDAICEAAGSYLRKLEESDIYTDEDMEDIQQILDFLSGFDLFLHNKIKERFNA